jgi:RNA polymerase sigma-70 factor (ECF subfamily)
MGSEQPEAGSPQEDGGNVEALFRALEEPLLNYALRLLRDQDLAQEVVQEGFVRLHRQTREVREPRSWLYRTIHNLAMNHLRQKARWIPATLSHHANSEPPARDPADMQPLPDEHLARMEGIGLVRLGLQNLDARSREIVRLKFNEELSYKEIALRTGLTPGHVGYLLHHALKSLAADLQRAGLLS